MQRGHRRSFINRGSDGELTFSLMNSNPVQFIDTYGSASYIGNDPIGIELAGALKNVYAIATGIADGLGFENNTRASERFLLTLV